MEQINLTYEQLHREVRLNQSLNGQVMRFKQLDKLKDQRMLLMQKQIVNLDSLHKTDLKITGIAEQGKQSCEKTVKWLKFERGFLFVAAVFLSSKWVIK